MNDLSLIIKKKLKKRKGLLNVIKTYKTQGFPEALIELTFLTMERLKINSGEFIVSRQAICLYGESKHLNSFEKLLIHKKNSKNSFKKDKLTKNYILQVEEI